jgi:tRNA A-37 threonylcarbamoyl transferase component Bud32
MADLTTLMDKAVFAEVSEIDPEWLTTVLRGSLLDASTSVVTHEAVNIGEGIGFAGRVYRLKLRYDTPTDAPDSIIVKLATRDEKLKALLAARGMLFKEARFYQELAAATKIGVPKAYYVAYDEAAGEVTIILEDLGDLQLPDDHVEVPLDECRAAIETIARLHAQWWNHPEVESDWLTPFTNRGGREQDAALLDEALATAPRIGVECAYLVDCMKIIRRHMPKLPDELPKENPVTLIHGDFHRNNMTFRDGAMMLFDWQIVERGSPVMDVVNMMMSGLEPDTLLANERSLLESYHQALIKEGVRGYGLRRLLADYRRAMLLTSIRYFVLLEAIDFNVPGGDELVKTLIRRTNQVAKDHQIMRMAKMLPAIIWVLRVRAWILR